jgi:DNA-binding IclR family transcriptional regulator
LDDPGFRAIVSPKKKPGGAVAPYLSYDVWEPERSVPLSPFAVLRDAGQLCDTVKSAVRALNILELLVIEARPLRGVEVASALSLSPSSANQLLKTLVDNAYLIFDPVSKRYCPSPRMGRLGGAVAHDYFGCGAVDALLRATADAAGVRVTLCASQGGFMQLLDAVSPAAPLAEALDAAFPVSSTAGVRIPMFGSTVGAAWLAVQDERTIRAAIRLCRRELGREADEVGSILERVGRVRRQGFAFGGISSDDAIRSVGVALPPSKSGVVLVLGASGPTQDMETRRDEIIAVIHDQIGRRLPVAA